jgi:hypothetical protein
MTDKVLVCLNCRTELGPWDDDHAKLMRCSYCGAADRVVVLEAGAPIPGDDVDGPPIDPFKKSEG